MTDAPELPEVEPEVLEPEPEPEPRKHDAELRGKGSAQEPGRRAKAASTRQDNLQASAEAQAAADASKDGADCAGRGARRCYLEYQLAMAQKTTLAAKRQRYATLILGNEA